MHLNSKDSSRKYDSPSSMTINVDPTQRAWIEIDGEAIKNNVRQIKSKLNPNCQFMAVVKADGYGHDAIVVSKFAILGGADQLGVATLQEGISLRSNGINIPILVLGNIYTEKDLALCFEYNLMPTISNIKECVICNGIGKKYKKSFSVHLKIDTGMSRLGFELNDFLVKFNQIKTFKNINIDGIYSHLACADEENSLNDKSFTQLQKQRFNQILKQINFDSNHKIKVHLANSAGTLLCQSFHFDMVRVGLSMYGYSPFLRMKNKFKLKPALFLKAKVSFVRTIDKDTGVSYGRKFISRRQTKLAVLSIGYADGISRKLSGNMVLLHGGLEYKQVGAITMDQLMVDITNSKDIKEGSVMILLGTDGERSILPSDWSDRCGSIPWEVLCSFKNRLPRLQIS